MKTRPILFNGDMVRAILSGEKTQTRRVVKYIPALGEPDAWCHKKDDPETVRIIGDYRRLCPFGTVGNRLWVRETWMPLTKGAAYRVDELVNKNHPLTKWRPSIHMPRWASRITLEIVSVCVERLQWIDDKNAGKEGIRYYKYSGPYCDSGRLIFKQLWNSIYKNWDEDPWVWVVEFKRVETV